MTAPTVGLVERVRSRLAAAGGDTDPAAVAAAVRAESGGVASDLDVLAALRTLRQEFTGAGPLDELLRDPRTTDVLVCGPAGVWVDRGRGLERTAVRFTDDAAVRRLAQRLAVAAGRRLDDACPYVDGWLGDIGVRLHAVLPPVAADGTCLSLRVLRPATHDLAALRALGTVDHLGEALVRAVLEARLAFLVSGGTGTGKTTILSALLGLVGPGERIVTVEDVAELRPRHPHVVRLVSRPANIEGAGGVELRDLVRQALRMRPDRLVVGEVRGAEVCELLAALNTGHDGGAGTVHANSAQEVPARMEALASTGGLSRAALHSQLAAAVQVVLHMRRLPTGQRVLDAVGVLTAAEQRDRATGLAARIRPHRPTRRARRAARPTRHGGAVVSTALLLLIAARWPASRTGSPPPASPPSGRRHGRATRRSWRFGGPVVVGAVAGLLTAGPGGALAGALLAVTVARARAGRAARTAATTGATELADALQRITDELRAGSHPAVALAGVTADGPVAARLLTPAATAARLGDDVPAALRRGQDTAVTTELGRVAAAWSLAERHGVPLADVLARRPRRHPVAGPLRRLGPGPVGGAPRNGRGADGAARPRRGTGPAVGRRSDRGAPRRAARPGPARRRNRAGRRRPRLDRPDPAPGGAAMTTAAHRRRGDARIGRIRRCSIDAPGAQARPR